MNKIPGGFLNANSPVFSVISVCYNDGPNLEVTARSVLGQHFKDFEWIVVDGSSTDGTRAFLERIVDARVHWTSEPDRGLFDAMNKGMDRSVGRYLIFMNSGDSFFDFDTLAVVANAIQGATVSPLLIYGDSIDFSPTAGDHLKRAKSHLLHWRGMFAQHQSMFFRRTDLRYDLAFRITADYAFIGEFLKSLKNPAEIIRLDKAICRFLLGGINEQKRFKALAEDYRIRRQVFGMNCWRSGWLYGMHYVHSILKRLFPSLMRAVRR